MKKLIFLASLLACVISNASTLNLKPQAFTVTGLVVLVDFPIFDANGKMTNTTRNALVPQTTYQHMHDFFNKEDFSSSSAKSSVMKYFYDQSNGKVRYYNEVIDWVLMPHPLKYYDNDNEPADECAQRLFLDMFAELKKLPDYKSRVLKQLEHVTSDIVSAPNPNYRKIRAMNIMYAGGAGTGASKGLWPHRACAGYVENRFVTENGVTNQMYNYNIAGTSLGPATGTICHENGHMLFNFPDMYGPSSGTYKSHGTGAYDLMGNGNGTVPPAEISPYLSEAAGWIQPTVLKPGIEYHLTLEADRNCLFKYVNPANSNQYYLVYNRQNTAGTTNSWSFCGESGIVIMKCNRGSSNQNPGKPRAVGKFDPRARYGEAVIMQADAEYRMEQRLASGSINSTVSNRGTNMQWHAENTSTNYHGVFSDTSNPSARWWDGTDSYVKIWAFSKAGQTMTCKFFSGYGLRKYLYTGMPVEPKVTVMFRGFKLVEGLHYKLEYSDNIDEGVASAKIIGIGMFYGTKTLRFLVSKDAGLDLEGETVNF